jgi:hypothetical protein
VLGRTDDVGEEHAREVAVELRLDMSDLIDEVVDRSEGIAVLWLQEMKGPSELVILRTGDLLSDPRCRSPVISITIVLAEHDERRDLDPREDRSDVCFPLGPLDRESGAWTCAEARPPRPVPEFVGARLISHALDVPAPELRRSPRLLDLEVPFTRLFLCPAPREVR